jgi:hypothetical protein
MEVFHARFGGSISLEQQLQDLGRYMPWWLKPLWKLALSWLLPWLRRAKIRRTMAAVDAQAKVIGDQWAKQDRQVAMDAAVALAKEQNPNAHVEVVRMPEHPTDAVYIEHPPTPGHRAEELLGFSSIEIKAPWAIKPQG